MKAPICVPCKQEMQCELSDCIVNDPASGNFPATYWIGDKWKCPKCGHEIVAGCGIRGLTADKLDPDKVRNSIEFTYA